MLMMTLLAIINLVLFIWLSHPINALACLFCCIYVLMLGDSNGTK